MRRRLDHGSSVGRSTRGRRSALATVAVVTTAVVLGAGAAGCGGGGGSSSRPTTGAGLYRAYCQTCHGVDGQGGVGPRLAGVMEERYPNVDDQIAIVANGTGRMPSFRGSLSREEIRKVVEYERTDLGR